VDGANAVIAEYRAFLPLTIRQIYYRLVAGALVEKTQLGYQRLVEALNRARRAGLVDFAHIRDDGTLREGGRGYTSRRDFLDELAARAATFRLDRQLAQPRRREIWCEASGMVGQLARVALEYGVPVYSGSGFNSLTEKYDAATRAVEADAPLLILHVGDHDPSGMAVFDSLSDDVAQLAADLLAGDAVAFRRVAVTPAQIARHALPTAPPKKTDNRGGWGDEATVQCEALPPDLLAAELRAVLEETTDRAALDRTIRREARLRDELGDWLDGALEDADEGDDEDGDEDADS
jgi:hypothetical protein